MKHKFLKWMILMILLSGIIYSCRQEFDDLFDSGAATIDDAQEWYGNNKPQWISLKFAKLKDGSKLNAKPDWKHAYTVKHKNFTVVQVPLGVQGGYGIVTPERKQAYEQTGDKRYMGSLTQMVVVTEKEKGKKSEISIGFLMTIVPDKAYLDETNFRAYLSSYKRWQKNFSGYIYYHTLEGDFANGWKLECGKVTKTVKPKNGHSIGLKLKSASDYNCTTYYSCFYTYNCVTTFGVTTESNGDIYYHNNGTECNEYYSDVSCDEWEECDYYGDNNGGGDCYCNSCDMHYDCNSGHTCNTGGGGGGGGTCYCYSCYTSYDCYSGHTCNNFSGGSSGGYYPPAPPIQKPIKDIFCDAYSGIINVNDLKNNVSNFSSKEQQFIISLANLAALTELGNSLQNLKSDLLNYSESSSLYTKLNYLANHDRYTSGWTNAYNSSTGTNSALISPRIGNSQFQLKFYGEKNGFNNALGIVKAGTMDHTVEAALEYIEYIFVDNMGYKDDFIYDMHLYNSINFMNYYCQ